MASAVYKTAEAVFPEDRPRRTSRSVSAGLYLIKLSALGGSPMGSPSEFVFLLLLDVAFALLFGRASARLRRLEKTSTIDPLTGLRSGHCFQAERWPAALRSRKPVTIAYVDLDGLKRRNDRHGHSAGNALICCAAEALRSACRRGHDEVFRLHTAGDEFILLLHADARSLADRAESIR